jgi:uncharacterized damage-inducible protein DinB
MLDRLFTHRAWANARHIGWFLALPESDVYCLKMLSHILLAERAWLQRLGGSAADRDTWETASAGELQGLMRENESRWPAVLATDHSRICKYRRLNGEPAENPVADILTHVCTHGMYHRGQVAAQAARIGRKCPPTDFIVFSREFP